MPNITLPVITAAAFVDSINPCAISVLLLTVGFLFSLNKSRKQIYGIAGVYILGIFLTYIFIGLGILQALTLFGIPRALSKIGSIIIIISGVLNLLEALIPNFPIKLAIPESSKPGIARLMTKATIPAMFGMGILVGLFEFPCTGGPYLFILSLLHDHATFSAGVWYLIYYNLIFVAPLVIILGIAGNPALNQKVTSWRKANSHQANIVAAVAMIVLGIVIFLL